MRFLQLRMFFSSQSVIFLALTGFYDWICKEVTHVWIEFWFSSFLIFVYMHLYNIREAKVICFLSLPCRLMHQARHKFFRKDDILHINGILKEWSNLLISESSYATTYSCNEECEPAVLLGETYELIYIWRKRKASFFCDGFTVSSVCSSISSRFILL